ncbi:putative methyltransferase-domain-containing protein [Bipolaris maydis]|nr:putative methyltransferase-domain-containing protein [Bipolaris maydis]KAJ6196242.1 putative methyltransferase-domain-containing protein [Bipolaris maydis]
MENPEQLAQLRVLQRQYFQLVEPQQLRWPDDATLKRPLVQAWLFGNLFDPSKISSPPPARYQLRVLKELVGKLERSMTDPEEDVWSPISSLRFLPLLCTAMYHNDIMEAMTTLLVASLPSETDAAQQKAFVTYSFPQQSTDDSDSGEHAVTLLEARSVISSSGTTGLRTWEAALLLGSYLASESGHVFIKQKRAFELGAGTGMLSILCAKHLGVAGIVATDGDEAVVDAIKTNLFLNGLDVDDDSGCQVRTAALKWGYPVDATTFSEDYGMEVPDVVIGADVTYDKSVIPRLVSTLREFFDLNPALLVFISATIRNEQTFETFLNACERNRFSFERVEWQLVPEHVQEGPFYPTSTPIQIWRIARGQNTNNLFGV